MKRTGIAIPSYTLDKDGNLVRDRKWLSVSKRVAQKKSKRVGVKPGSLVASARRAESS